MARKLAHESRDDDRSGTEPGGGGRAVFERRGYLRLVATTVGMSSLAGVASASETTGGANAPEQRLSFRGRGDVSAYELTVDGDLLAGDAKTDAAARISGCSAEGVVKNGDRSYRFSGEIRDLSVDGDAEIYLDRGTDGPEPIRVDPSGGKRADDPSR
jgi:hypothetical protein